MSAEVSHTYEELIERILHAGMSYAEAVDQQTSLVICDEPKPDQGKGYQAGELGVPVVGDAEFMSLLEHVVGGTDLQEFTDPTLSGDQFTLF